jgi:hypothetical protein
MMILLIIHFENVVKSPSLFPSIFPGLIEEEKAMVQNSTASGMETFELSWNQLFGTDYSPERITDPLLISVTPNTYPPKLDIPRADWVTTGALPAFQALTNRDITVSAFASISTGAGVDALTAAEILKPKVLVVTDVHEAVVQAAQSNIMHNLKNMNTHILAGVGDLCRPLAEFNLKYDVIYENLPNIPLPETQALLDGLNSSSFTIWSGTGTNTDDQAYLLELHRAFLREAKPFLAPGGRAISCIGARVPIETILKVPMTEGYAPEILVYNWKLQSEATEGIRGYAENQRKGLGPFHFYPMEPLVKVFDGITPQIAAANALELEYQLAPHAIDAETALTALERGEALAHTLVVVASSLRGQPQHD